MSTKAQSPLDKSNVKAFITTAVQRGLGNAHIAQEVQRRFSSVKTSGDSIRRFKARHGLGTVSKPTPVQPKAKVEPPKAKAAEKKEALPHSLIETDGKSFITVFHGGKVETATSDHPFYEKIRKGVLAGDASVVALMDPANEAARKFKDLSDRISIKGSTLYIDGEKADGVLADQIVSFLDDEVEDWRPLVAFYEKLLTNPNEHSRKMLYGWLRGRKLTLTPTGNILGYRGVQTDMTSTKEGTAIVNGEEVTGKISNKIGNEIRMPRGDVNHNPRVGCSTGLHVGTWSYADRFGPVKISVEVNPRDVVSVPTDCNEEKMRVCKMIVKEKRSTPYTTAVVA